ncbi:hypothetical protein J421_2098 [Gemmatirosa kalamazoonensis]|uniref:CotH protein n=1 Tax=Gemmatirosa kalamazoonensis TaxID=861299 RepID=W0RH17_9BACT|nr:hypothetical protein [Gemmatirosa kalamazoonensis]AHG89635.1 hypothetical protein J421_2098 [Gemmatirosa kalamazoonensis]
MLNVLAGLALAGAAVLAQPKQPKAGKSKADKPPKTERTPKPYVASPLFATDSVIHVTLTGDWKALGGDRDTLRPKLRAATLAYTDSAGRVVRIPVQLSTRGHFRLSRGTCSFPPLRVVFDSGTKHTLFAGQKALKLGTHCNDSNLYEQYVLREYLAYRAHNLLTPVSFRPRLARMRYVDVRDTTKVVERWGMFLESERELGDRLGGDVLTARGGRYNDVSDSSAALLGIWEYFIGNTDFSLGALHNVRLVTTPQGMTAVPYDFDFSGLVDTRYSSPDPRLPIKTVRERLYRGPCLTDPQVADAVARFTAKRDAIRALYESVPALDKGYAKRAVGYIDDFFADAKDTKRFAKDLRETCLPGT